MDLVPEAEETVSWGSVGSLSGCTHGRSRSSRVAVTTSSGQGLLVHFFGLALDEDVVGLPCLDADFLHVHLCECVLPGGQASSRDKDDADTDELCLIAHVDHRW